MIKFEPAKLDYQRVFCELSNIKKLKMWITEIDESLFF